MAEDVRRKILVRRATFLAAALTGLSAGAAGCDRGNGGMGQPCLSIAPPGSDAAVDPEVCLKVAPKDPEDELVVCLSVAPPQPPPKGSSSG